MGTYDPWTVQLDNVEGPYLDFLFLHIHFPHDHLARLCAMGVYHLLDWSTGTPHAFSITSALRTSAPRVKHAKPIVILVHLQGGIALFGPHMYFVGRHVDEQREELRDAAQRYAESDEKGKEQILDDYREKLMGDARVQVEKARHVMAGRSERLRRRNAFLKEQSCIFVNYNGRGNSHIKHLAAADPHRSSVRPLAEAEAFDAHVPDVTAGCRAPVANSGGFKEMV